MLGAVAMVVTYSLGVALPSESVDLVERFGVEWQGYQKR